MGLRDFFKAKRQKKFKNNKVPAAETVLSDEEIAKNWIVCKNCNATIYRTEYAKLWNVCPKCGFHGRLNISQRIEQLTDKGSFEENEKLISPCDPLEFCDDKPYKERLKAAQDKTGAREALVCGTAKINGIQVVLALMNFEFIGGSMGSVVGEKLSRAVDQAIELKAPFITLSSSGGARMHEGILSLMQMAKTSISCAKLSEAKLPFISLLADPTFGGVAASFATLGDLLIAEPHARIGFAGRRVIEETVREKLPEDFQTAEYLLENGQLDLVLSRSNMKSKLAQILTMMGYSSQDGDDKLHVPDCAPSSKDGNKQKITPKKITTLDFEKPLSTINKQIQTLEKNVKSDADKVLLRDLRDQYKEVETNIFKNITAIDRTKIARHPQRPYVEDYLNLICGPENWVELRGDRAGTDDQAILCAVAEVDGEAFVAIGTRKGRNIRENQARNFGMPQPEGYRKAKRFFELADKFDLPIVTFIDTPGAYPGINAEARGQSIAIAENLKALAQVKVPVVAIITGEGGSGGALAIGVANKVMMLENSIYSVISPEGCAAILWRTRDKAADAAEALKITARDLNKLGIVDEVIDEPLGGAHRNYEQTAETLKAKLVPHLKSLNKLSGTDLQDDRAKKFNSFGSFIEEAKN